MRHMLIFGLGYSAARIADRLTAAGWQVTGTSRSGRPGTIRFDDDRAVTTAIGLASHILASIPPDASGDPVLTRYGDKLDGRWLGYLSSTGVYGDAQGAWVDESTPTGTGRRSARAEADAAWLARGARVFRLPGIYGPGRSAIDRVLEGRAHRIDLPGQVFSRVHVDDIASGVIAGLNGPAGAYNLADDWPCSQNEVIDYACAITGSPRLPLVTMDQAGLSPMARGFYAENRRVANGRAKRVLGWTPVYSDYRAGLLALSAMTRPAIANTAPPAASGDQR
ncbi:MULTISPECIES: NAD(P)-dependent oxidoreductase [unclassified Sphingomonas]|uniref:NAD(P)-dependent oxidoreductase n=1 Tax=unclassified Sphingomonas TaxID=196159 RepID=UPI000BC91001|nr:MAG: NAD(P)-dependent oxidoreductase [Sphingomonas sp. 12-62-6]OYX40377.1 MAG: NAD(P)-dependent oxidoreductase [Sphingomonas sp. 32-62-10]